jgi:hypothetical protein
VSTARRNPDASRLTARAHRTPATEYEEAAAAQLREVRGRLVREGVAAGLDEQVVDKAVDDAEDAYVDAAVRSFVGILVERAVREKLDLAARASR